MSVQSHWEINVSKGGKHLFATAPRSCTTEAEAEKVYNEIKERFPELLGFEVTVTYWKCEGFGNISFTE